MMYHVPIYLWHVPGDTTNLAEGNSHRKFNNAAVFRRLTMFKEGDGDSYGDGGPVVRISSVELQFTLVVKLALSRCG